MSHLQDGSSPEADVPDDGRAGKRNPGKWRGLLLLAALAALIAAVRLTGIGRHLEPESLRQWIGSYGGWAPLLYLLVYALAPALLLPGLPLTIAGGILFGPFWGVFYAIIGATLGACIAFLAGRYVARGWVERRLSGPRWRRLNEEVEKHGWKAVAFTRLIPLFPFNLLNYAFGLTRVRFLDYVLASAFCMLPACIAYVVFSSSLWDLLAGRVSPSLWAGLALVVLVGLIPFLYQRHRKRKGLTGPL